MKNVSVFHRICAKCKCNIGKSSARPFGVQQRLFETRTQGPDLIHPRAAIHPGTIKTKWLWTCWCLDRLRHGGISEPLAVLCAHNAQPCERAAVIKMTSAPLQMCILPFPWGISQFYFQLYFTPDNSIWALVHQLRHKLCVCVCVGACVHFGGTDDMHAREKCSTLHCQELQ